MPKLKPRRIFPAVYFVNKNLPEEKVQEVLSEKELTELPDETEIPSKNQILIALWKVQVQHSAMGNTMLETIFVTQNF